MSGDYTEVALALDDMPAVGAFLRATMDALRIPRDRWWLTPAQETVTFAVAAIKVGELVDGGDDPRTAIQKVAAELDILPGTLAVQMRRWRRAAGVET